MEEGNSGDSSAPAHLPASLPEWVKNLPAAAGSNIVKVVRFLLGKGLNYSNVLSQRHRDNESRSIVSKAVAAHLAKNIGTDDPTARRAFEHFSERILQERENLDDVVAAAVEDLAGKDPDKFGEAEISDDWLAHFEDLAKRFSSEAAKARLSKVLSGEIQRPGTFSFRGVSALANLDPEAASALQSFGRCALASVFGPPKVVSLGRAVGDNQLSGFGISFHVVQTLQEHGLVVPSLDTYQSINFPKEFAIPFRIGPNKFTLFPASTAPTTPYSFRLHGVSMTTVGQEVYRILDQEVNESYFEEFRRFVEGNHLVLRPQANDFDVGI